MALAVSFEITDLDHWSTVIDRNKAYKICQLSIPNTLQIRTRLFYHPFFLLIILKHIFKIETINYKYARLFHQSIRQHAKVYIDLWSSNIYMYHFFDFSTMYLWKNMISVKEVKTMNSEQMFHVFIIGTHVNVKHV